MSRSLEEVERAVDLASRELRREFLKDVPCRTIEELRLTGLTDSQVEQWKAGGRIFAVPDQGREHFPAFQFEHGRPLEIVGQILATLRTDPEWTDWDSALWFAGDTGWLDGARPLDQLTSAPEAVLRAAEQQVIAMAECAPLNENSDAEDVLSAAARIQGNRARAIHWYRSAPIPEFGDHTAEQLVAARKTHAVLAYLASITGGSSG